MSTVKIEVLECMTGVSKKSGRAYNIVLARLETGKVGKFFSDVALPVGFKGNVDLKLSPNAEMSFGVGLVKVSEK